MDRRERHIIIFAIIACVILFLTDSVFYLNYVWRSITKILLFIGLPIIYYRFILKKKLFRDFRIDNRKRFVTSIIFGVIAYLTVFGTYLILRDHIDLALIGEQLKDREQITAMTFILVSIYITFANSFIEEFFFRGFIVSGLNRTKLAYIFSSVLFGLYHISIFQTWFNPWLIALALVGLISVGFILNWLNSRSGNIINSWTVHILADMAVMTIGFIMFGYI